jgi:CheY-like chemotaxis protein
MNLNPFKWKGSKRQKPLLLHADDEDVNIALVRAILEEFPIEIVNAEDGAGAVKKAKDLLPGLILLDVQMPGLDGLDACSLIKKDPKTAAIPVYMLTALDRLKDMEKAIAWGANGYMTKPIEPDKLAALVAKVLLPPPPGHP